ncbi:unnamed protein product [Rotaria sp. Silwood2]|nr:unnamed protein product [Rotaria sp. Silwood2]
MIVFVLLCFLQFHFLFSSCIPSFKQCGCSYQQPILSNVSIEIVSIHRANIHLPPTDPSTAFCGGTLINEQYVLTAAHCFYDENHLFLANYFVVVGAHYINETDPIRFNIQSIVLHENYHKDLFLNDIAVLKLSHKVDLSNSKIGFICLPPNNISIYPYEHMHGIAVGWGRLEENGSLSYALQQVELPIISNRNQYCFRQISDEHVQFCAGLIQGGKDTCQGDSGGPLMILDMNTSTWYIAGITSYGYGCAKAKYPGVYTRVSMFIDWINDKINSSSQSLIIQMPIQILLLLLCIVLYLE